MLQQKGRLCGRQWELGRVLIFSLTGDLNCEVTGQDSSYGDYFVLFTKTEGRAHCGLPHTKVLTSGQRQPG